MVESIHDFFGGGPVSVLKIVINVIHILISLFIITTVLLQKGKQAGLSGSIGGAAETFFGKGKAKDMNSKLSRLTSAGAILFLATSITLQLIVSLNA
jgi:preprotein translocase subunit SecG